MKITIKTEKFTEHNQKYRRILAIDAFQVNQLPDEYFEQYPHCSLSEDKQGLYIAIGRNCTLRYTVGDVRREPSFQGVMKILKNCASQLQRINNAWKGEETIEI